MRTDLKLRLAAVAAELQKIAGPRRVMRDPNAERETALEEVSLEGAIFIMEKLEEMLGVPANTNAKADLAEKIKALLLSK
jgi:hypothetical protein